MRAAETRRGDADLFTSPMARILVIDDDSGVRGVLKILLERAGHVVTTAGSGEEGLQTLGAAPVDLVLVDIEMPKMNGFDVCSLIRTDPARRGIRVVLMTGRPITGVPEQASAVGALDLIHKPFQRDALLKKIADYLATNAA